MNRNTEIEWMNKFTKRFPTFTPSHQSYYSASEESECLCPSCENSLDDYDWENKQFEHCPDCGQALMSRDEYEDFKEANKNNPDKHYDEWRID